MKNIIETNFRLRGISIYRNLLNDKIVSKFMDIITKQNQPIDFYVDSYSELLHYLFQSEQKGDLSAYIYNAILYDENLFALICAENKKPDDKIEIAAKYDIQALLSLANTSADYILRYIAAKFTDMEDFILNLPQYAVSEVGSEDDIINHYKTVGYGYFAKYTAFYFDGSIKPVENFDKITLDKLYGFKSQKQKIMDNTSALVRGFKSNNILLYGDRGTGKSSTVKAVVNHFSGDGLRLIEVSKDNLKHLGKIIDVLAKIPMKFIIFVDDLTFADGDDSYTAMKAILEGSANALSNNMVIYATTNRRHLITETFSAREGDEIHLKDTMDEAASLSDRFGITITFEAPLRREFNNILLHLAEKEGLKVDEEELFAGANRWAVMHSGFTPRVARQYIDYLIGQI